MRQSQFLFPRRRAPAVLLAALLLPLPALAVDTMTAAPAADEDSATSRPMQRMQGKQGQGCPMMKGAGGMRGGMGQMLHMPRLPPGNDKLQLQMEAEILQQIGEIQGKYASQLP